jgi:ABC-type multidrug transport system ATPase subunit
VHPTVALAHPRESARALEPVHVVARNQPRVILLDEPSLGLAPMLVEEIFQIVQRLNKEQKLTVLLVEQNATLALAIADHGYVMENGRIVLEGSASTLRENADIKEFYLGLTEVGARKSYLADQICDASGGPCSYLGRDMKTTHKGMKITEAEWNATVENLGKALDKNNVGAKEKQELVGALAPMKGDIVGQ